MDHAAAFAARSTSELAEDECDGAPVTLVGVRGSRESLTIPSDGMGPTVSGVADRVEALLQRTAHPPVIRRAAVAYPARSARYRASRAEGVRALGALVAHLVERRPDAHLVLIGLSQGADVIRSACAGDVIPSVVEGRIAAIVLLGDPGRDPALAEPYQHGTTEATPGLLARGAPPLPRALWSRTWAHCLEGDRVCAARIGRLGAIASGTHTHYGVNADGVQGCAAAFVVDRLRDRGSARSVRERP